MERRHRINGENTPKHQPEIPETTDGILDLLSLAPYGAYAVDISQIIVFWNRSAERILGHKADRIIGHRCYKVLQHLPGEGSTPICMEGCPSIRLAREGRIPPVVRVRARCVSGLRKEITVTPLIVPAAQEDRTLLLHLFNENLDEAWATRAAMTVQAVLSEGKSPAVPTDLTTASVRREASALTVRELDVLRLVALGLGTKEIAVDLDLSPHTVRNHIRHAREKLKAPTRLAAVLAAQRRGLL